MYFSKTLRRDFWTSRSPDVIVCQPGKRTTAGVWSVLSSRNNRVKSVLADFCSNWVSISFLMSDNGAQPTSEKYENASKLLGITLITTSYSNPKGNADTEGFIRTFKEELVYPNEFDSFDEAKNEVDKFIKFYNEDYPHSTLGYLSPINFEKLNNIKNVA